MEAVHFWRGTIYGHLLSLLIVVASLPLPDCVCGATFVVGRHCTGSRKEKRSVCTVCLVLNLYRIFCSEISCIRCRIGIILCSFPEAVTIGVARNFMSFKWALRLIDLATNVLIGFHPLFILIIYPFVFDLSSGRCPEPFQFPIS